MLTVNDKIQIEKRGSDLQVVENQIKRFETGFPFAEITEAASLDKGIVSYTEEEKLALAELFDSGKAHVDIIRFVPASGAATRMFKALFALRDQLLPLSEDEQNKYLSENDEDNLLFSHLETYPFFRDLELSGSETPSDILNMILDTEGLSYGTLPKGQLKFHSYGDHSRTAFEEHFHEAVKIGGAEGTVKLHFTVSEDHLDGFKQLEAEIVPRLQDIYDCQFKVDYSFQKKETDTIAVDMQNQPFRDEEGKLVFRPGGHGALLENLNDLSNDIIFINNIDNVSPERNAEFRALNKKMLGGVLLKTRNEAYALLEELQNNLEESLEEALKWLQTVACLKLPDGFGELASEEKINWAKQMLDRPVRVAGMVKNEGEPGGGPFFIRNSKGLVSLQIVEKSQVDLRDDLQAEKFGKSSHFNPVDLVCSVKDKDNKAYNLLEYIDVETGFISEKSVKGKDLKALELPGLWNGSMAEWITIFVEVPGSTFTPVKTVFDLVRDMHR